MNVLHLIDTYGTGGAESVFLQLISRLDRTRYRSFAAVLGSGWLSDSLESLGVGPLRTSSRGSLDWAYLRQLIGLIRRHRIDLVQTHLLTTAVYGGVAARLCAVPVVSTFHGLLDVEADHLQLKSIVVSAASSRIVFVSESLRRAIVAKARFLEKKSQTIYNGVDVERFSPRRDDAIRLENGILSGETLVGSVGRLIHAKGFDTLIRAAALLREHPAKFKFIIAGEELAGNDTRDRLIQLRDALNLQDRVRILPFRDDVERLFNNLDIFALSSRTEGFSLTTIEAMASGLPVVATRSGGPEEIVRDRVNGLLVPVEDPSALARALSELAENLSLRDQIAVRGRETAVAQFNLERTVHRYQALYDSLSPAAAITGERGRASGSGPT